MKLIAKYIPALPHPVAPREPRITLETLDGSTVIWMTEPEARDLHEQLAALFETAMSTRVF